MCSRIAISISRNMEFQFYCGNDRQGDSVRTDRNGMPITGKGQIAKPDAKPDECLNSYRPIAPPPSGFDKTAALYCIYKYNFIFINLKLKF